MMKRHGICSLKIGLVLLFFACGGRSDSEKSLPSSGENIDTSGSVLDAQVFFIDVAGEVGLDFVNVSGSLEQPRYILETQSAGASFLDYDGDGFLDLFAVNGTRLEGAVDGATNRLFHNEPGRDGRVFREVTSAAGLAQGGWGMGCAVGDYDNDGDVDIYVTYWGPNRLYRNEGDGSFVEVAAAAAIADSSWSSSAAFGDLDGDGFLDLYVTNYLEFDLVNPPGGGKMGQYKGIAVFYGPKGVPAQPDRLYRNKGNGTFADVSAATGVSLLRHPALGVVFGDYDVDGDLDVYVANDSDPNLLFRNEGNWLFAEVGALAGVSHTEDGRTQAGMGVHSGDYDNDGDLDLFVTNFEDDVNTLYRNQGEGLFADATYQAGLGGVARPYLGWGTGFFDYDNDGWLDLFVANGHLYPQLDRHPSGIKYSQRNLLYHNERGRFVEVGFKAGPGWQISKVSRAAALGDYDNDGDVDVFVANLNDFPSLLRNEGGNRNNWLGLELVGVESNPEAIGARVQVSAGALKQVREVHRGYGFQSQHDPRLVFGLGGRQAVDRVEIRWPSGRVQVLEEVPLRRYLKIREGNSGLVAGSQLPRPKDPVAQAPLKLKPTPSFEAKIGQSHWSAGEYVRAGKEFYQQGRYGEARAAFEQAIRLEPDSLRVYGNLAVVLFAGMGRDEEAAKLLEHIIARVPERVSINFLLGKVYLSMDRLPQAIKSLKATVELSPRSWEAHNWLGLAYLRADSLEAAVIALRQAARGAPWRPGPHQQLARVYEKLGREQEASRERRIFSRLYPLQQQVDHYRELIELDQRDAEAHSRLGAAYMAQERLLEAIQEWQRALSLDPQHEQASVWIRRAHEKLSKLPPRYQPKSGTGQERLLKGHQNTRSKGSF